MEFEDLKVGKVSPSLLAILARFNWDALEAQEYCATMARGHESLSKEYWSYYRELEEEVG